MIFGRDRSLIGSICKPAAATNADRRFVVFLNSGVIHRAGPNRSYVRIARALGRIGVPSLRFDLSGIGDSMSPPGGESMSIQERSQADIDDALNFLATRYGAEDFVLIGLCSGADNALRTMGRDERVVASVLLDLNVARTFGFFVRYYLRRATRLESWRNVVTGRHPAFRALRARLNGWGRTGSEVPDLVDLPEVHFDTDLPPDVMRTHLEKVVARGGQLLCIFTAGLEDQYNYREQFLQLFRGLDFRGCLRLEYFGDADHTFSRVAMQARLTETIVEWVGGHQSPGHDSTQRSATEHRAD